MTVPEVTSYRFGEIGIKGQKYTKDVIVFPDRVYTKWWRETGHSLSMHDLREVLPAHPRVLIIGTGIFGRMRVPKETREGLAREGIQVIIQKTKDAIQTYNRLREDGSGVATLHLSC